jgi:multiple sugar transport system substrate-binding protein
MKKRMFFVSVSVVLFVMLPFFACSGKKEDVSADKPGKPLRITSVDSRTNGYIEDVAKLLVQKIPGASYDLIKIPQDEYNAKVSVMLSGGDDVDIIFNSFNGQYMGNVSNGLVRDLTPLFQRDNIPFSKFNGIIERFMVDGKIYGMPTNMNVWQVFYNKDIFDKRGVPYPPVNGDWTWDEYREMLKKLTYREGNIQVYGGFFMLWEACVQNIGVQSGKHTLMEKEFSFLKYPYELVLGMQKEGTIMPYSLIQSNNLRFESAFLQGQAATVYQGNWMTSPIVQAREQGNLNFEWGIAMAPYPPDAKYGQVVGTAFTASINENAGNPDLAWEYLKLLPSDEGAEVIASYSQIPAINDERFTRKALDVIGLPEEALQAFWYNDFYFELAIHDLVSPIDRVLQEEHTLIMTESITVDEGIKHLNERIKPIWDEYEKQK